MQVKVGAETLGYDINRLTDAQRRNIIDSLVDPKQNIIIAAKHLSDLRDIDFKGIGSQNLTTDNTKIITTRYNRGPHLSIEEIKENMSYGEFIVERKDTLEELLNE